MDNITHSLLGAALAKTRLGRSSPIAPAALIIGANLPDLENAVLVFLDQPANMIHHRGVTHAVVGVVLLAPLFALLMHGIARLLRLRNRSPGSLGALFVGVGLATASHPLLDWLNTYGLRPWLPFDDTRYCGDLVFIIDPWLWLLLGATVCLAGRRTRVGSIVLGCLALALTAVVLVFDVIAPRVLQIVWPVTVAVLVLGRGSGVGRRRPEAVVAAGVVASCAYVGFLGWSGRTAWGMSRPVITTQLPEGEAIIAHTISPMPGRPLRWQIVAETQQAVYRHTFSILDEPGGPVRLDKRLDDPLVREVAASPEGHAWRVFARHAVAAVARYHDHRSVLLMDARYPMFPAREFSSFEIRVPEVSGGGPPPTSRRRE